MDSQLRKELQTRARVEAIFNKTEEDFPSKREYDDYLEEREDIIFNLVDGTQVDAMELKIKAYQRGNADNIARNEARKAEELRKRAAAQLPAGGAAAPGGADLAGVSGTAAAFHDGLDAEPHQGMDVPAPVPVSSAASGPLPEESVDAATRGEQWRRMALNSGWSPEFAKQRSLESVFGSLLIVSQEA